MGKGERLHVAAERGDVAAIHKLLRGSWLGDGADVNWCNSDGSTALHAAAWAGHAEAMRVLLQAGANVGATSTGGWTPLLLAACNGHMQAVQVLLQAGADVGAKGETGRTPLHYAAMHGYLDVVQVLLAEGADVGAQDEDGKTPLDVVGTDCMSDERKANLAAIKDTLQLAARPLLGKDELLYEAAERGDVATIQVLVSSGANVSWRNPAAEDRTPLHAAARHGHAEAVRVLRQAGADVSAKDQISETPLHRAAQSGSVEAVRALLQAGADASSKSQYNETPLHKAARHGCAAVARVLLQAGADVLAKEKAGWTALHLAAGCDTWEAVRAVVVPGQSESTELHMVAHQGHVEVLQVLLQAGAEVRVKDKAGRTPLHLAAGCSHLEAMRVLLQAGADVGAKNMFDRTPLHTAAQNGHLEAVHMLLQSGTDVRAKDEAGWTPLHLAALHGRVHVVRTLLRVGADVGTKGQDGRTPLHLAAWYDRVEVVQVLLQAGADFYAKSKAGWTALHLAAADGRGEAARVLLRAGADMDSTTKVGWAPLHHAAAGRYTEVIRALLQAGADPGARTKDGRTLFDINPHQAEDVKEILQAAAKRPQQEPSPAARRQPSPAASSAPRAPPPPRPSPATTGTSQAPPPPRPSPATTGAASGPPPSSPASAARFGSARASPPSTPASPPTSPSTSAADGGLALYSGGTVTLPSPLTASQALGVVRALASAGLQTAVQVVGAVATCNPVPLVMAPMQLLQAVQTLMQQGVYCQERLRRTVARIAAMEPALQQLAQELKPPVRTGAPHSVVQSLCATLLLLANVLVQLQQLQSKLLTKGAGLLPRTLQLLKAGGCEQEVAALDLELRDCVTQLSAVLNIAHFTQVAQVMRAREELQVAQWQRQNDADRARDLQQMEGLVVQAIGGIQALQQQLEEQKVVLDGQAVGLQQVAEWLQRMHASSSIINAHLQQLHSKVDDIRDQVAGMHVDLGEKMGSMQDELQAKLDALIRCMSAKGSSPRTGVAPPMVIIERSRITIPSEALAQGTSGGFGTVFKAMHDGCEVAVKVYNHRVLGQIDSEDDMEEALLLSRANHHNVVRCFGILRDPDTPEGSSLHGSLVMEWVGGGTLYKWLQSNHQSVGLLQRVQLALQVATGMRHLHERRLVHGDLKPQNVLLTTTAAGMGVPQAKICDFGLAKHTHTSAQFSYQQKKAYTVTYTSPERITTWSRTPQDDVYAFGILMYFIATSRTPFTTIPQEQLVVAVKGGARPDIDQWLAGQAPSGTEHEVAVMYRELAKRCWAAEPGQRPMFDVVHGDLSAMLACLQG